MKKKIKFAMIYTVLSMLILLVLGSVINVFMTAWAARYITPHTDIQALPESFQPDCILVLGAKVFDDNTMSVILTDRVDVGLDTYEYYQGEVPLLLSGAHQPGADETTAMALYVSAEGVGDEFILTDSMGVNTYASISRAKEIFNAKKMIIVTQDFHMARSIFIARSLGIEAYGVTADLHIYYPRNYIREYFARIKDAVVIITRM